MAIDSKYQQKGLGIKLINFIQSYYYKRFKKIIVGTQSNNKASLKFYKQNKFRIFKTEMVFHKHF
jgi:ribosomal protein S18 acetylase RimI-like enzyme